MPILPDPPSRRVAPTLTARHPLLAAAAALVAGILLHDYLPLAAWLWLVWAACLAVAALLSRSAPLGTTCCLAGVLLLGTGVAQSARFHFPADHIAHFAGDEQRLAELELRLVETPRLLRVADIGRPRSPKHVALADVTAVRTWDGWEPASGRTLVQFDQPCPSLAGGDLIRTLGKLERPGEAMNPGQFDFAAFYRSKRVLTSFHVPGPQAVTPIARERAATLPKLREQARRWLLAGFRPADAEHAAVLRAMLLGERDPAMADAREAFRRSGTGHYLAISGLHVGVMAGLALGACRLSGWGPRTSLIVAGVAVAIYGTLAVPSPPVLRATVLALAFGAGLLWGRRGAGVQLLALAAIGILLLAPLDVYRAGFQLSFVTVLGLMVFAEAMRRGVGGMTDDEAELLRAQREHWLVATGRWVDGRVLSVSAAAVVAWLASMPLVAVHFEQFNPWAIPATVVAAPLVVASLLAGVLKIAFTAAVPGLDWLWAEVAALPVRGMRGIVEWFSQLPGADVPLPAPSLTSLLAFYVALCLWRVRLPMPAMTLAARTGAPAAAAWLLLAPFLFAPSASDALRVTVLAVGAGQCIIVETPAGRTAILDAGSMSLSQPVQRCIGPFLRSRGLVGVDLLLISHPHADHYNAAPDIVRRYEPAEVLVGHGFARGMTTDRLGRLTLDELHHLERPPRLVAAGDVIPLGRDTRLLVIYPDENVHGLLPNDISIVLRLEHAGRRMLIPGDVQAEAISRLLHLARDDPDLLRADVLIAPHHGSSEVNTAALIAAVDPQWIIASDGRAQSQKQRDLPQHTADRPLLRTHRDGAVTLELTADTLKATPFRPTTRRTLTYPE